MQIKKITLILRIVFAVAFFWALPQTADPASPTRSNIVADFLSLLDQLGTASDDVFFKHHCASMSAVIQAKDHLTETDSSLIEKAYVVFTDPAIAWNAADLLSYLARKRPFIISWTSPTDQNLSFAWMVPPQNWDPQQSYPLYVRLHGLSSVADNSITYLTNYFNSETVMEYSFEDGYMLLPWGRGNLWYEGIGETDIWESIDVLQNMVKIDPAKKYLTGFSMGGYGTWALGQKSPQTWAALGIYAGALNYGNKLLTGSVAEKLAQVPVYFICGTLDGLLHSNETAYSLLQEAGNENLEFNTFTGSHESRPENWLDMYEWLRQWSNPLQAVHDAKMHGTGSQFSLSNNYPNPFNATTCINYSISRRTVVSLNIYSVNGKLVKELVNQEQNPGEYRVLFDAADLASGNYLCRLRAGDFAGLSKMTVVR
jgi:hypothetical protein